VTAVVLQYTIPSGQVYLGVGRDAAGDYYYARSDDANVSDNHTLIMGNHALTAL
jgi:hypothetical protein